MNATGPTHHHFVIKSDRAGRLLTLPDGTTAVIRLSHAGDREGLVAFHRNLSDTSVYLRYFSPVNVAWRTGTARIAEDLINDPVRHLTLIVERCAADYGAQAIIATGHLVIPEAGCTTAELALTVRDEFQGMGVGSALLDALIVTGRAAGLHAITATVLAQNQSMLQLCREHGFQKTTVGTGETIQLSLDLHP